VTPGNGPADSASLIPADAATASLATNACLASVQPSHSPTILWARGIDSGEVTAVRATESGLIEATGDATVITNPPNGTGCYLLPFITQFALDGSVAFAQRYDVPDGPGCEIAHGIQS
jgi:hypothetical protein